MDDSDRTAWRESPVVVPEHLVFAIEEWLQERFRRACDDHRDQEMFPVVAELFGLHRALADGSLTPAQTAELADGAADWLQPLWPTDLEEADEAARLLAATRGLLALRDRARAAAADDAPGQGHGDEDDARRLGASVFAVDPGLVDVLRLQSLLVLEANHQPFEEVRDLEPSELVAVAAVFRDAIAVLDTIGWLQTEQAEAVDVAIAPGHLAQLRRRRAEIALALVDRLDDREHLVDPEKIAEADAAIAADRVAAHGLLRLLWTAARQADDARTQAT
jgi:hypothetical protein